MWIVVNEEKWDLQSFYETVTTPKKKYRFAPGEAMRSCTIGML
jgi:hypothetical protein